MFTRLLLMGLLCLAVPAQSATLFPTNSTWRFKRGNTEASTPDLTAWRLGAFNDTAFADAPAPFWYGDARPGGTQLSDMMNSYTCIFLRKTFTVNNVSEIGGLRLTYFIDDGFIAWINGQPVFSENVTEPNPTIATLAANQGVDPAVFNTQVSSAIAGVLQEGVNTLAIQAFNTSAGSSDFGFDCMLESIIAETTPPVITSVSPTPNSTVTSLTQVTVTFSEPVVGVNADDLLIQTQPAASVSGGGTTYTFTFTQPPYGAVGFTWFAAPGITDTAVPPNPFDPNGPNATWQLTLVDTIPPVVDSLFPAAGSTIRALSQIEVTFSEEVTGVEAADLLINNQPATSVTRPPGGPYIFTFPEPAAGAVNIRWATGHGITDQAAAPNAFAGGSWSYVLDPSAGVGDLVITEFNASNQNGLLDEDGDAQDWVEIYNRGVTAADLTGWSLSDDPEAPSRWVFPVRVLPAGQYLVVFASGKDRRNPTGANRLHTSFQLSSGGEFLGLYNADSPRALVSSYVGYPEQRNDISYGLDPGGVPRYFSPPTPGAPNGTSSINGVVEPVHFSVTRGHYTQPFDLVLTCPTPGAVIRYRTDGVEPTATTGLPYVNPLRVTNTTLLRAAAFRVNRLPSVTDTHSYLFNLSAAQRSLPIMSVVTAVSNLIGRSGIIGMGGGSRAGDGLFITNNPTTDYHNPSAHGIAWERKVSAEYIQPADNSGFQIDAGLRVQGSDWQRPRTLPTSKFSFRLYFRGDYGDGRLDYPMFPLTSVQSFDQLVLRAGFNDQGPPEPFVRDETIRRLSHDMGQVASHGGLMNLFTNGGFAGYYNPCERVEESFLQSHLGGGPEWDVITPSFAQSAEGPGIVDGDRNNFNSLINYVWVQQNANTITNPAIYREVARRLDLPNFVDYCLLNAYVAMGDWPANNWRAGRERSTNGIWRFIVWDAEWGMGIYALAVTRDSFAFSGTGTEDAGLNSTGNSEIAQLYQRLRPNREFRLLWADRIHKHFHNNGALTGGNISNRFNELRAQLATHIPSINTEILDWARDRRPIIFNQFNTYGLYGFSNALYGIFASSNAPAFNQHGGAVAPRFKLTMTAPLSNSVIYYTTNGDDPRVMFTGAVSNSAVAYAAGTNGIEITQSMRVRARSLWQGTNWSAINEADFSVAALGIPLRLTELNYNPTNAAHEFLEIQNVGGVAVDLSGMSFEGITYEFTVGAMLAPGARLVLVSDFGPAEFASRYPGVAVFGYFSGNLNNGGERIALKDRFGNYIFTIDYDDAGGWPTAPDGGGFSLEVADAFGDPDDPANWHPSAARGGSPGAANSTVPTPTVRLNEVLAENGGAVNHGGTFPDYVEIQNTGGSSTNLAGWSLTDDGNARKFVFPSVEIPAGGYLVVWCDDTTNTTPGLHTGFSLQRGGDNVYLFDASTNRVDALTFGLQLGGQSVGRVAGEWVLNTPTPDADNAAAPLAAAASLSINEWQASAPPGQSDWIELHNTAAQPVALRGCYLSNTQTVHRINSLSFVPAFGFVQLFADEGVGPDHLDFRLSAAGGTIVLSDAVAAEVNRATYTNAVEGLTRGRLPDGTATIVNFPGSASPGASNYVNTYTGAILNEVLARNRSAVTNGTSQPDYVELFNSSGTAFPLFGMSLSVNVAEPGQYVFPINASVPANGYLVIWCDGARPAAFGPADYNTGQALDGESGGACLFNAQGQVVNSVEYGHQVRDLPIGLSGGQWRLLTSATPGAANSAVAALGTNAVLRFNEWMANPASGPDWFELFNPTNLPIELSGLFLTDDPSTAGRGKFSVPPLSFIGPRGFVQWIADGDADQGRDHVNFSLDAGGESIWLFRGTNFALIDTVAFDTQLLGVSEGRLPDGQANIVSFIGSATPAESNYQPPSGVVINEVLTHSDAPLEDAVELRNTGATAVNLGGWYLSDSQDDFKKYRIPDGTTLAAGGFAVFYQNQFSSASPTAFTFDSAHGDEAWLSEADANGNLTGYRTGAKFGAAANGVSFGRVVTSVGVDYAAMSVRTFGQDNPATVTQFRTGTGLPNAAPQVGPVLITEIMYNPVTGGEEYIELHNTNGVPFAVNLFTPDFFPITNTWRLSGAVEYSFPLVTQINAGEHLLVVGFNPLDSVALAAFRARYNIPGGVRVFGPFTGRLDNAGEKVQLLKPDQTQPAGTPDAGFVPYIVVDEVNYGDSAPWPSGAVDGGGLSLQRQGNSSYGNEPLNWRASTPTPGAANGAGIVPAPVITASPQSQAVIEGQASTLAVTATGAAPIGYQWRFNGTAVPNATNAAFSLDYVILDDDGVYDCLVSNPGGAAVSAAARLAVQAPAVILIPPVGVTNRAGSNIVFTVGARGSAPLTYQWRLNGVALPGATSPTLVRTNIQLADDGEYEVVISNPINSIIASAPLVVLINTTILTPPAPAITVVTGATFSVSVAAAGNPLPFSYDWRRQSTVVASNNLFARADFMTFTAPTNLVTNQVWRVVVRNLANQSLSANAQWNLTTLIDSDSDGIPDNWETAYGFNAGSGADRDLDADGDGLSNAQEYRAGTDPTNALSRLTLSLSGAPLSPAVSFSALSNRTYAVQFTDDLGAWQTLADVLSRTSNRVETVVDPTAATNRSYRVVTPRQP
jgi:hypothetical protein